MRAADAGGVQLIGGRIEMMGKRCYVRGASKGALEQKDQDAITADRIAEIQRQMKIGDAVSVKTNKGCNVDETMNRRTGVWRKGTVIGIFRNFVHDRLQSGVCESVLWTDIMNEGMEDQDEEE